MFVIILLVGSCQNEEVAKKFVVVSDQKSTIQFNNIITETDSLNYFVYPYLYLGGGVAVGDLNNDGLTDIYFTGNMVENKLYLNEGNWTFKDITKKAGLAGSEKWYTGVTMCDVNDDGWLDIYVCVSGKDGDTRNELYINNKDLTFTESAAQFGLDDEGASIQSVFFDYDGDGDLDVYVGNYPATPFSSPNLLYKRKMDNLAQEESDHLYENQGNGSFKDVSEESGIANFGLTLGLSAGDFNNDGHVDIYVSNDFSTPDRFFVNQGNGRFEEKLKASTYQNALFGMGCDAADYNNDGLLDLIQVDMTPEDNQRSKENMASMNPKLFWNTVDFGFHYQYMYNALQLNQGINQQGNLQFSNVARLGGLATTDWSWAPIFADFDNDGHKDIFITNGIKRDVNNKDFFEELQLKVNLSGGMQNISYEDMPSEPIPNQAYRNDGQLTFENVSEKWGLDLAGFSHGTAYADFDNDGDLDVVVNNMDQKASLYDNQLSDNFHYLKIRFQGQKNNPWGLGTKATLYHDGKMQHQELTLTRGFQSSVAPVLHFGLGENAKIDSLRVVWSDGKSQIFKDVSSDQLFTAKYGQAKATPENNTITKRIFKDITEEVSINFQHQENEYNDFLFEPLLPHQTSRMGSGIAVGDVNNDGLEDFFVGNAKDASGALFLQGDDKKFAKISKPWSKDALHEDMDALFFDADNDGDLDLYVVSGGNEFARMPQLLQDRLYLNDGKGAFKKSATSLPEIQSSGSRVKAADYDLDGDLDLFVGGKMKSASYPLADRSYILRNEGLQNGVPVFKDVTATLSEALLTPGMVTDALWTDFNNDQYPDLVLVGEWMPVLFFENAKTHFVDRTESLGDKSVVGWWYSIAEGDFDGDGDMDLVVGNLGNNYKYQASPAEPFELYVGDFDKNKRLDLVLSIQQDGEKYPLRGRQCSSEQIPAIKYKFKNYNAFASATLEDVYGKKNLENALQLQATHFASSLLQNNGTSYEVKALPPMAQFSSVNGIIVKDINGDKNLDLILAGNLYASEVETPRNDASLGLVLMGNGKGDFRVMPPSESGLYLPGDVKDIQMIQFGRGNTSSGILAMVNDDVLKVVEIDHKAGKSRSVGTTSPR
ncbi:MAG: VCBS repeat-containing protein [Bacteroidota bacterium]